jgi:FKBP-type peptidyl-prolyl cis-trans isomerase FkpA
VRPSSLVLASALLLLACSRKVPEPGESTFKPAAAVPPAPPDPGPAELETVDEVVGTGRVAKAGDAVRVHYTGTLLNGTKFDSSRDRGTPFDFTIGKGAVIKGWDQGVVGMRVGGKRRLVIPQALGYGEAGSPPNIPPKAGLRFEIELLDVNPKDAAAAPAAPPPDMDPDPDMEQDPEGTETP